MRFSWSPEFGSKFIDSCLQVNNDDLIHVEFEWLNNADGNIYLHISYLIMILLYNVDYILLLTW